MKNTRLKFSIKNRHALLFFFMLTACLSACSINHSTIIESYATDAPFDAKALKTYRWDFSALGKKQPKGGHFTEFDRVLFESVNKILAEKGYQRAETGTAADFVLDYRVVIREQEAAVNTPSLHASEANPFGFRWVFGRDGNTPVFEGLRPPHDEMLPYQNGTLYFGAFNKDKQLIWYHSASRILSDRANEAERRSALRLVVEKLMADFPSCQ